MDTPKLLVAAFMDEIEKISMARIGIDSGGHVALRLLQRANIPRTGMGTAERALKRALREPAGMQHLGPGDFFLPVGDKGTLVFSNRGEAGHVASTFLGPGMAPKGRHIGQSSLSKADVKAMKKKVKMALKPPSSPKRPARRRFR